MMKHISILVPDGNPQLVSIVGTYKAFTRLNKYLVECGKRPKFTIRLVGHSKTSLIDDGLFSIRPHLTPQEVVKTDLIIIPAINWDFANSLPENEILLPWIVDHYNKGAEVASICSGGFLLASTGLLKGKNCSVHWMVADQFRKMFPDVNLVIDKVVTDEDRIYTNGGTFSFLQLLLYLIEKYCDRETAIYCSKILQVDIDRKNQSAFMMFSGLKDHHDEEIKKAQLFIENNFEKKIFIEELAAHFGIGRRNFDRRFIKATTITPINYLQRVKIEAAKKALETGRKNINEVMYDVGYTDLKAFRDVFKKITSLSPIDYRNKYNKEVLVL